MASANLKPDPDSAVCFAAVLAEELAEVSKLRKARKLNEDPDSVSVGGGDIVRESGHEVKSSELERDSGLSLSEAETNADLIFESARKMSLVGIAFSGGGIRSATFNLGVLQGLAEQRLLPMFDYVSTFSGGGYIGSWLSAWILRVGLAAQASRPDGECENPNSAASAVQEALIPCGSPKLWPTLKSMI